MSSDSPDTLYVFDAGAARPRLLGRLRWSDPARSGSVVEFVYARSYLASSDRFPLHPILLPLTREIFAAEGLAGPLGVFGDAAPDAWGRRVLESLEGRALSVPEQLVRTSNGRRLGLLEFSVDDRLDLTATVHRELADLLAAADKVVAREAVDEHFRRLLEAGSSMGGQHPKSLYRDDGVEWIAKFPGSDDRVNMARVEHATLRLAARCGIHAAESRVVSLPGGKDVLLVKRFDRIFSSDGGITARLHYMSSRSVCGLDRYASGKSYPLFAEEIRRIGARHQRDCEELFRRMVFNIMVGNVDDHSLNHGMLWFDGGWQLSPAFDVVAGEGSGRGQAMAVGVEGSAPTVANALSQASRFGLSPGDAEEIVHSVQDGVAGWKSVFDEEGVSPEDQAERCFAMMASAAR
ncbi:MAG: type II toxin-antitoxin system HipA family toxin [Gammaproteobacteria bacterium]|nr:type II toxin-antitoxin system HipA family toxin [Gammaproteobacteria bacterium]MCW8993437.1 type II toxin-antitoxin system HipA family toxin [Gammaproteobacteria bacterium]